MSIASDDDYPHMLAARDRRVRRRELDSSSSLAPTSSSDEEEEARPPPRKRLAADPSASEDDAEADGSGDGSSFVASETSLSSSSSSASSSSDTDEGECEPQREALEFSVGSDVRRKRDEWCEECGKWQNRDCFNPRRNKIDGLTGVQRQTCIKHSTTGGGSGMRLACRRRYCWRCSDSLPAHEFSDRQLALDGAILCKEHSPSGNGSDVEDL